VPSPSPRWLSATITGGRVRVSLGHPTAVVERDDGSREVVTWPDLPTGWIRPEVRVAGTPGGAWVGHLPEETFEGIPPETTTAAVHIALDGRVTRHPGLPAVAFLGATRHGLWLASTTHLPDPDVPDSWRREREVLVVAPDGTLRTITVDRVPLVADDDGTTCRLIAFAGGPGRTSIGGGGWSYDHAMVAVALPDRLPRALRADERDATPLDGDEWGLVAHELTTREEEARPDDPVVPWDLVPLPDELARAATEALVAEFGDPDAYWGDPRHPTDRSPLAAGMSGSRVTVVGAWPRTRVEIAFRHPHVPEGLLRRTIAVFDAAGRIATAQYASIHLMEDVETGHLPPASAARDGILEI
jgi:hypothetical protein